MAHVQEAQEIFTAITNCFSLSSSQPSVKETAHESPDPFRILIAAVISSRTKDQITREASARLFKRAPTVKELSELPSEETASLIYPCGFYHVKAERIRSISKSIMEQYQGSVPNTLEELTSLPGVGRKTANLTLGLGFGIPSICVDVHVHRISQRLNWSRFPGPAGTETALMELFPQAYWISLNPVLVQFGQNICLPRRPRCLYCPVQTLCPSKGKFTNQ